MNKDDKFIFRRQLLKERVPPRRSRSSVSHSKNAYIKMMILRTREPKQDQ